MGILIFILILIVIWQGCYWLFVDVFTLFKPYVVPSPIGVAERFLDLIQSGTLLPAIGFSLARGFAGYLTAIAIGLILGLLLYRFSYLQKNLRPVILGLQTLPSVCWVPFSILWFGLTTQAILFVVVMGATFSIAIALDNAIKNVPPIYIKVALTMGAKKSQLFRKVILPSSLPELISGLKQGWSFGWRALMAGEVMTTSIGLGQTLITGRDLADINQIMLVMIIIVVVGIVIDKCFFSTLEQHILKRRGLLQE